MHPSDRPEELPGSGVTAQSHGIVHPEVSWWHRDLIVLFAIGTVATLLRCYQLGQPGIWFDESSSCRWIEFSTSELCARTAVDCHPPFYWLLLKVWSAIFGQSVAVLRSMSVLFGVATVGATYGLVRELQLHWTTPAVLHRSAASLAALMVALSPFQIEWSQEMRMYSLGTFLVLTSTWLLAVGLRRGGIGIWSAYAVVGVMLMYTLYFSLFTLLAHGIFVVGRGVLTARWSAGYFAAAAAIGLGWLPWVPYLLAMYGTVQRSFPQGPLTWAEFSSLFWWMFVPQNAEAGGAFAKSTLVEACAVLVVLLIASRSSDQILIALCAFVPIYSIVNISILSQNLVARHRLILGQIFLLIGWALFTQQLKSGWLRRGLGIISVVLSMGLAVLYLSSRDSKANLPGMQAAISSIDHARSDGDMVLFVNPMLYLNGIVYTSNRADMFAVGERDQYPYYQGSSLTRESDHLPIAKIPSTVDAVWVVDADHWFGTSWQVPMPQEWQLVAEDRYAEYYADIVVKLYRRVPAVTGRTTGTAYGPVTVANELGQQAQPSIAFLETTQACHQ